MDKWFGFEINTEESIALQLPQGTGNGGGGRRCGACGRDASNIVV